ncbi:transcriptional activator domain protein [Thermobaculum terrenum ATCC BAA-798]|uniref:Transcriptional activator domain protein n=1 Tax=Thermobaculum terrenum (strain ATCC BAA-798 / CCMEE 7001 / YNP1) TaxID=525904 RepID=D1CJ21_THET1|nr:tetratricopeptide repeat protein [Thermobaculum terrenum]ACZ43741.1 transcriptional activator domain protein [Thermobaculum terrenum ATCC BAA-798]
MEDADSGTLAGTEGAGALYVQLLGEFRVAVGSRVIERSAWRLRKASALIKLLAIARGQRLHREQVVDLLWPDLDLEAGMNNLHYVLGKARRVLEPDAGDFHFLRFDGEWLVLSPLAPVRVDVGEFERAARLAHSSGDPASYFSAIALYTGELLPEDRYEEWVEERRRALQEVYLRLHMELAGLYESRGEYAHALDVLRRAVELEPTLEAAHAGIMRLLALLGRPQEALRQYEALRAALARELDASPQPSTTRLREEILQGHLERELPSVVLAPTHNLPSQLASFVGRTREIEELERLLAGARLLTLTGVGGSGKTRLAVEVSRRLVGTYPDGVWLVELAGVASPELVPNAVASVLGVRELYTTPMEALIEALRSHVLLLVLDNCEHLVEACAELVRELLVACGGVRVLATSRQALRVEGEVVWRVPAMSLPATGKDSPPEEMLASEAVQLFVQRARTRAPDFELTEANAAGVLEICQRLEGLPLALEIAAAQVSFLSVEQLAEHLDEALGTLSGESRTPRHETIRAAMDWSYERLGPAERALFQQMAVFAGGATLQAISSVAGMPLPVVISLLASLVDRSMVAAESVGTRMRYRLIEPVRRYALRLLQDAGGAEAVRRSHAQYYLSLAERACGELGGQQQVSALTELDREYTNLQAVLSWALDGSSSEDVSLGAVLAGCLWPFWDTRGRLQEAQRWLSAALAIDGLPPAVRARLLAGAGMISRSRGEYDVAMRYFEEELALSRDTGDAPGVALALNNLGLIALDQGRYDDARAALLEGLAGWRMVGDPRGSSISLNRLGLVALYQEEYQQAEICLTECLRLRRAHGSVEGMAVTMNNLGLVALHAGAHERAAQLLGQALTLYQQLGNSSGIAVVLNNLGRLAVTKNASDRAVQLCRDSLRLLQEMGDLHDIAECLEVMAAAEARRQEITRAARLLGAASALRKSIGAPLPPVEHPMHDSTLLEVSNALGETRTLLECTIGQEMTLGEVLAYALESAPSR